MQVKLFHIDWDKQELHGHVQALVNGWSKSDIVLANVTIMNWQHLPSIVGKKKGIMLSDSEFATKIGALMRFPRSGILDHVVDVAGTAIEIYEKLNLGVNFQSDLAVDETLASLVTLSWYHMQRITRMKTGLVMSIEEFVNKYCALLNISNRKYQRKAKNIILNAL